MGAVPLYAAKRSRFAKRAGVAGLTDGDRVTDRTDAEHLGRGRIGGFDRVGDALLGGAHLLVDAAQVLELLESSRVARRFHRAGRCHARQQRRGAIGRDLLADSARHQLDQQRMKPARGAGAGAAELFVALCQQPQHRRVICRRDLMKFRCVPRRERRCTWCSPEPTSIGAVPL